MHRSNLSVQRGDIEEEGEGERERGGGGENFIGGHALTNKHARSRAKTIKREGEDRIFQRVARFPRFDVTCGKQSANKFAKRMRKQRGVTRGSDNSAMKNPIDDHGRARC